MWNHKWKNIYKKSKAEEELGIVLADEEYKKRCRITLEKCNAYYAITCDIYGAMRHSTYCGAEYQEVYDAMKRDLQTFLDKKSSENEAAVFYEAFTSKY